MLNYITSVLPELDVYGICLLYTSFYLLMIPGDKTFKTKELSHQIGSARLSFASPQDMDKYLDITPGSVLSLIHILRMLNLILGTQQ